MLPEYFAIIGTLIGAYGAIFYIRDVIKGRVKPNRVSFLLWSIITLIAFIVMVQKNAGPGTILVFSASFLPFLVFLASFLNKKAYWKITRLDKICGLFSVIGIVLWIFTKEGNIALFFNIFADFLATLPTIWKAYKHPETETGFTWILNTIGSFLTLLTIKNLNFTSAGYVTYILIANFLIFLPVQFNSLKTHAKSKKRR